MAFFWCEWGSFGSSPCSVGWCSVFLQVLISQTIALVCHECVINNESVNWRVYCSLAGEQEVFFFFFTTAVLELKKKTLKAFYDLSVKGFQVFLIGIWQTENRFSAVHKECLFMILGFLFPGPWQYRSGKIFGTLIEEKQLINRNLPLILVSDYCNERLFTYISW